MRPKVCVILPTYNEADNVRDVIPKIFTQAPAIPTHDLHVLVVDDNSPDGTQHVVRTLMDQFQNLHLITGPKRGLGEAYKRGIYDAMKRLSPDIVFHMDADGQHDPSLIPLFAYLANHGFSLVIGSRFAPGGSTPDFSKRRRIMSIVGSRMLRFFGGLPRIHDCTSGFRCIKAEVLNKCDFRYLCTKGYSFQSSELWELLRNGASVIEVPITFSGRTHGESKLTYRDLIEFLVNVVKLRFHQSEELIRFILAGLSGILVNLGSYVLLTRQIGYGIALACPIAIALSILSHYLINNMLILKYSRIKNPIYHRLFRFYVTATFTGSLHYIVFLILAYPMHVYDMLANIIGISIGMVVNFFLHLIWILHQSRSIQDSTINHQYSPNFQKGQPDRAGKDIYEQDIATKI